MRLLKSDGYRWGGKSQSTHAIEFLVMITTKKITKDSRDADTRAQIASQNHRYSNTDFRFQPLEQAGFGFSRRRRRVCRLAAGGSLCRRRRFVRRFARLSTVCSRRRCRSFGFLRNRFRRRVRLRLSAAATSWPANARCVIRLTAFVRERNICAIFVI